MELQARLREADPDLTVIIMTGYAQRGDRGAGAEAAAPTTTSPSRWIPTSCRTWWRTRWSTSARGAKWCGCARTCRKSSRGTELIGKSPAMQQGDRADRDGGAHRGHRADHRRKRHRQGSGGARHPRGRSAALHADGDDPLRRADRDAAGKRAVRPREGRVHRRAVPQEGQVRSGRRRHASSWTRSATSA